jgi:hypothetical protein
MPRTVIFLEDLCPEEKGLAEMLAPVSIKMLTLCFSIVSKTRCSSAFMVVREACMGGPRICIGWEALISFFVGTGDSVPSNGFPNKWGRVLEVAFSRGTPF